MAIKTRAKNSEPEIYRTFLRFEILTAITVHITVLWRETLYNFVHQSFGRICWLHLQV
jgi:hypothetical protein